MSALGVAGVGRLDAQEEASWDTGEVAHLLPTVSHERLLIKLSLLRAHDEPPTLRVDSRAVPGRCSDTEGEFWVFDAPGLEADRTYELSLFDATGRRLCDPWPLATFPAPDAEVERLARPGFRLLAYTCAGGHDLLVTEEVPFFLSLAVRRRLLARGLSFAPDAVLANGDHVYWDQRTGPGGLGVRRLRDVMAVTGEFDRSATLLGSANEGVLKRAVGPQIAALYGSLLRSTPVFFLQDDHDYFDGDRVSEHAVPFPPDPFMIRAARASQWLYYPEFLPDRSRPAGLPSASMADRPPGVAESYGTLRYGPLLEVLIYDCRRYMTLKGELGTFLPLQVEAWIKARIADAAVRHLVHSPSVPVGWTAGKWGEWYPDVLGAGGRLVTDEEKSFWQRGWLHQHDRILQAASAGARTPLFLNGDLHSLALGTIRGSGALEFHRNPIRTVLTGPLGTNRGWPSAGRGTVGRASAVLDMVEELPCREKNGFSLVDFTPDAVTVHLFQWRPEDGEEAIDTLEPFRTVEVPLRARG